MKRITLPDRIALLITCCIAAYQIVVGIEGCSHLATWAYTIAFGVLLIAGLLMIINGFEVLNSSVVILAAALIPLGISFGVVVEDMPAWRVWYAIVVVLGLFFILISRAILHERTATIALSFVHGTAGVLIVGLPFALVLQGMKPPHYLFVSMGGCLIGIGGLLLALLKTGKPIFSAEKTYTLLPWILLLMSAAFVLGLGD